MVVRVCPEEEELEMSLGGGASEKLVHQTGARTEIERGRENVGPCPPLTRTREHNTKRISGTGAERTPGGTMERTDRGTDRGTDG